MIFGTFFGLDLVLPGKRAHRLGAKKSLKFDGLLQSARTIPPSAESSFHIATNRSEPGFSSYVHALESDFHEPSQPGPQVPTRLMLADAR